MDFRPAYAALAARLRTDLVDVVRRVERRNLPAKMLPDQPALVVLETDLGKKFADDDRPVLWELGAVLVLFTPAGSDNAPGEQLLYLLARIEAALRWREGEPRSSGAGHWTTLGGAVLRAKLEDATIEDDIYDAAQVATLMHVRMMVRDTGPATD